MPTPQSLPVMFVISYSSDGRLVAFVKDRFYEAINVPAGMYYALEKAIKVKNWKEAFRIFKQFKVSRYG